jgi:hypothetical protein
LRTFTLFLYSLQLLTFCCTSFLFILKKPIYTKPRYVITLTSQEKYCKTYILNVTYVLSYYGFIITYLTSKNLTSINVNKFTNTWELPFAPNWGHVLWYLVNAFSLTYLKTKWIYITLHVITLVGNYQVQ